MFSAFKKFEVYQKIEDEHTLLAEQEGFIYLNSKQCIELFAEMKKTEQYLMDSMLYKNQLMPLYKLFHEEQKRRETTMLQNIYNYSKEHSYNKAIFMIGAAHRKSIMQKINEFESQENLKLNWQFPI